MQAVRKYLAASTLVLSAAGVSFIQNWEGTKEVAYLDSVGVPTICTGSTKGVYVGQHAKLGECEHRLHEDTTYAGAAIQRCVREKITQEQYDALVALAFNIGGGATCGSTLVRKLNQGDCRGAAEQFLRWDHAGKQKLRGLTNRRKAEREQFLIGCE